MPTSAKKENKVDKSKQVEEVAAAAGRAVEKAGIKAAEMAKTNPIAATEMLKIAKKTAKEAATAALSDA